MDLDVRRLRVLREVAVRGTVAGAAAALGYTPSAISQQLTALERESGVVLRERAGRGVRLTDAGQVLVSRTGPILEALEAAAGALEATRSTVSGQVKVSCVPSVAAAVLIPRLAALQATYPDLSVTLFDDEMGTALQELTLGRLDLVVAHEYTHARLAWDTDLTRVPLFSEEMLVAAPVGRLRPPVTLAGLAGEIWAAEPAGSSCGRAVREACRAVGFEPDVRYNSTEFGVVLAAVAAGAVSFLPLLAFEQAPPGVECHRVTDAPARRLVFAAHRPGALARPAVAAVLGCLTDATAGLDRASASG